VVKKEGFLNTICWKGRGREKTLSEFKEVTFHILCI
jgi:hypothetical protein